MSSAPFAFSFFFSDWNHVRAGRENNEHLLLVFDRILALLELYLRLTYCLFLFLFLQERSDFVVEFLKLRRPPSDLLRRERTVPHLVHVRRMLDRRFQHLAV